MRQHVGPGQGEGTACSLGRGRVFHAGCDHERTPDAPCCDYSGTVWLAGRAGGKLTNPTDEPGSLHLELMLFRYAPHRAIIALRGKCSRLFQKILGLNM